MTAISLARYVTALATDGKLYTFRLLSKICDANGNVIEELIPEGEQIEGMVKELYAGPGAVRKTLHKYTLAR